MPLLKKKKDLKKTEIFILRNQKKKSNLNLKQAEGNK